MILALALGSASYTAASLICHSGRSAARKRQCFAFVSLAPVQEGFLTFFSILTRPTFPGRHGRTVDSSVTQNRKLHFTGFYYRWFPFAPRALLSQMLAFEQAANLVAIQSYIPKACHWSDPE